MKSTLKLVTPSMEYAKELMDYRNEFLNEGEKVVNGAGGLGDFDNTEEYLNWLEKFRSKETVPEGFVPSTTWLAINEDNILVGIINIRHELNDYLLKVGGHIGYGIRKSQRKKGYATEMLKLALKDCKNLNLEKVLITCNSNNIASEKTILNNSGVFENEIKEGDEVVKRFWIEVQ